MLLPVFLTCALAATAAAPVTYDERQEGGQNVHADVRNIVLLLAMPKMQSLPASLLDLVFLKSQAGRKSEVQDRSDIRVMEAFVEPSTPYRVDIGSEGEGYEDGEGYEGGDGRAAEVVIAGRRRAAADEQAEGDELKLLGATEQCGPDRERDPVTLTCRAAAPAADAAAPAPALEPALALEPVPAHSPIKLDVVVAPQPEVVPAIATSS